MSAASVGAERFEARYRAEPDPWSYETSEYEREKYARTLAEVPEETGRALEIGCSIGVFTELLAARCGEVAGVDFSAAAIERARERTSGLPGVSVRRADLREGVPAGPFDLVVCSEVLYYLDEPDAGAAVERIEAVIRPGGRLLSANWRGIDPEAPLDAESVERLISARPGLERTVAERHAGYLFGVWVRTA